MIVLDTNVLAELMRREPHPAVSAWVASQPGTSLYTTSITQAEILYCVAMLPKGRRRDHLASAATAVFDEDLDGRILPFNSAAAARYAAIVATRRHSGSPIGAFDALIAAIALTVGAGIATRDVGGFDGCGLSILIDPWGAT